MATIRGHFDGKVIVPDEPHDLQPGQKVIVQAQGNTEEVAPGSSLDWMIENAIDDPSLPSDLSVNLKHYLYGHPKKQP